MAADVMDTREAAAYLRLSVETIKRKARAGAIPSAKVGRGWRFRRADLDAWLSRGGTLSEERVDKGIVLAVEKAMQDVEAGREQLVDWNKAKAALGL
jgi:excisionase family DNA binding protein